ncbi:MAG TPA: peptide deformylase [Firmicutes bacterium]|nr:peptide deformylase [Bacillota bacterium]
MIREILVVPHPVLRKKARPVEKITKKTRRILEDMAETMYASNGVGLAAPQIGISERLITVDTGDGLLFLINPELVTTAGQERDVEGCLSIPGQSGYVTRAARVVVEGLDPEGRRKKIEAEGLLSRALQHEIDHLDGILYTDHLQDGEEVK